MQSPFVHAELHSTDVDRVKGFYADLLGWEMNDVDMGGSTYTMVKAGEGPGAGIMQNPAPEAPPHWMVYVGVADLDESTRKAKRLGGKVLQAKIEVPNMGAFSVVQDPDGAVFGLWQGA